MNGRIKGTATKKTLSFTLRKQGQKHVFPSVYRPETPRLELMLKDCLPSYKYR